MKPGESTLLRQIEYFFLLGVVSACVLVIFLKPTAAVHIGINEYYRSTFMDMVDGKAYRPFVYRALLPGITRLVSYLTPDTFRNAFSTLAEQNYYVKRLFATFQWESSAAYRYFFASLLMYLSLLGFAHYAGKLLAVTCGIEENYRNRAKLALAALLALPPFFKYASYVYDPPQLFLFTSSLYFLAAHKIRRFCVTFALSCINKETAVLLIPIYGFSCRGRFPGARYIGTLLGLILWYVAIRALLTWVFRSNPGTFVEFHLFNHNIPWLTHGWRFTDVAVCSGLLFLMFYKWKEKPYFLRISFICTFVPLAALALVLGYIDEWRVYYEAYPAALALIVDSLIRIKSALDRN